ncbi:MAG: hypothetical protein JW782_05110 [Candidatus Saganbacteria bacterium]|nr:hypothetical protein [Candidatus Saganbacteria bacterium]
MANSSFRSTLVFYLFAIAVSAFLLFGCGDISSTSSSITISPSSATVGVNQSKVFTAIVRNSLGQIVSSDPSWSATIGSISTTGLFSAGNTAGTGQITATCDGKSDAATVTVTEHGWIEGIAQSNQGVAQGIKIYLRESPSLLDYTDSSGKYSLADVPAGTYWVVSEVTATFQSTSLEVTLSRGQTTTGNNLYLPLQPGIPDVPTTTLPEFTI